MEEIEKRLSEIAEEIENPEADLEALNAEVDKLTEERTAIKDKAETRKSLLEKVAKGQIGTVIETVEERKEEKMEENVIETVEYRNAFYKKLMGKKLNEAEERIMTVASEVGAAIPTQTLNKIEELLRQTSALYNYITVLNIPGNLTVPVEATTASASWVAEGTASTDSDDTLSSVTLAAYKLIKTVELSANVTAMSIPAFEAYIVKKLADKIAIAIEYAILNGAGTTEPTGVLTGSWGAGNSVSYSTLGYDDFANAKSLLKVSYNGIFTMNNKTLWATVAQIKDQNLMPIFVMDPTGAFAGRILGTPVVINEQCPDDTIVLGDFSKYVMNFSSPVAIEADNSVGFRTGSKVYRAMALADGKVVNTEAFVKIYKSISA